MSNSSRNPKGLRDMVDHYKPKQIIENSSNITGNNGTTFLNDNLKNLNNLTHEEKTELGMLKNRIEDQSRLIMAMKQRCDEFICKNISLEKFNHELLEKNEALERNESEWTNKYTTLEDRFNTLASNHQDLTKIKDEYKDKCAMLTKENKSLIDNLANKAIEDELRAEREILLKKIEKLHSLVSDYEIKCNDLIKKHEFNLNKIKENNLKNELDYQNKLANLNRKLDESNQSIKDLNNKLIENTSKCDAIHRADTDFIELLKKEKKELLNKCERLNEEKKQLANDCLNLEDRINKLARDLKEHNTNKLIQDLEVELELSIQRYKTLETEFASYKKYSVGLLEKLEKEKLKLQYILH